MSYGIHGIGTANPETVVTQEQSFALASVLCSRTQEQRSWLPTMYERTRLCSRHTCLDTGVIQDILQGTRVSKSVFLPTGDAEDLGPTTAQRMRIYADHAPRLAHQAALRAITKAGFSASEISHLITVSCTGFLAPGIDHDLMKRLNLPAGVQRTHVGYMGCHGALNALRLACAFTQQNADSRVMVVSVELCSLHYHFGWKDPGKVIANAIFADGAAAVVGKPDPDSAWKVTANGSHLFPGTTSDMSWTIGDHGFEMTLSKRVPALIARELRTWIEQWLTRHGLTREQIKSWAIHPGGPRILEAVASALELTADHMRPSWEVYQEFGNMSSATLLFILDRLRRHGADRPCVMLGFGPGLVVEAALIR